MKKTERHTAAAETSETIAAQRAFFRPNSCVKVRVCDRVNRACCHGMPVCRWGAGGGGETYSIYLTCEGNLVAALRRYLRRCADDISFNGYRLLSTNLSPLEHVLEVGEQRYFYNLQLRGELLHGFVLFNVHVTL